MNKWDKLKLLVEADLSWPVQYSSDKNWEKGQMLRFKEWMEYLDREEAKENERQSRGTEGTSEEV